MCNGSGPVRLASHRKTSKRSLQSEATLIWGDNGILLTEARVGNPDLRN
jgi:hypothetical protein